MTLSLALGFVAALLVGMAIRRRLRQDSRAAPAADFYILVMDIWAGDDPHAWLYSARATTEAELLALPCYQDPPKSLHRAAATSISRTRVQLPCCQAPHPGSERPAEWGTVHGMRHV